MNRGELNYRRKRNVQRTPTMEGCTVIIAPGKDKRKNSLSILQASQKSPFGLLASPAGTIKFFVVRVDCVHTHHKKHWRWPAPNIPALRTAKSLCLRPETVCVTLYYAV